MTTSTKLPLRAAALAASLALLAGCIHQAPNPDEEPGEAPVITHSSRDVINVLELSDQTVAGLDAYQVVQRLRPNFFVVHPGTGPTQVSVDNSPPGPLSSLRNLRADAVSEIRLLSATEAAQRFGPVANRGAVIVVRLR